MKRIILVALVGASALTGARAQEPDLSALMGALSSMMNARTNQPAVEVVDFRELRALLPEKIGSYQRVGAAGEKNSAMGFTFSQAEGQYEKGKAQMQIKLLDYGSMGVASMMSAAWAMTEIDRETDKGFERTVRIDGFRGMERYDGGAKYGELQLLVADRFLVEIEVRDADAADLRAAVAALDLKRLAGLAK